MIYPTVGDVIRRCGEAMDSVVIPGLSELKDRSSATTIRHLLNFAADRIDVEGQLLFDEIARVRDLLGETAKHFSTRPDGDGDVESWLAETHTTLERQRDPNVYPALPVVAEEVNHLRGLVSRALIILKGEQDRGTAIRQKIREYIAWQIQQEAKLIEPAFQGRGPRR